MTEQQLDAWFARHPTPQCVRQASAYAAVERYARRLAVAIAIYCPESPDATAAVQAVREAAALADRAIAAGAAAETAAAAPNSPA